MVKPEEEDKNGVYISQIMKVMDTKNYRVLKEQSFDGEPWRPAANQSKKKKK